MYTDIADSVYLLDVLVVVVHISQELLGVLIIAPGLRWVFWGLGGAWEGGGGGGGGCGSF